MPVSLSAVVGEVVKLSSRSTLSLCCSQTLRIPAHLTEAGQADRRETGNSRERQDIKKKRGMVGLTDTGDRWRDIGGKVHNSSACL